MSVYDKALPPGIKARRDHEADQREIDKLVPMAMEEFGKFRNVCVLPGVL